MQAPGIALLHSGNFESCQSLQYQALSRRPALRNLATWPAHISGAQDALGSRQFQARTISMSVAGGIRTNSCIDKHPFLLILSSFR